MASFKPAAARAGDCLHALAEYGVTDKSMLYKLADERYGAINVTPGDEALDAMVVAAGFTRAADHAMKHSVLLSSMHGVKLRAHAAAIDAGIDALFRDPPSDSEFIAAMRDFGAEMAGNYTECKTFY